MAVAVIMRIRLDKYLADMGAGTRSEIKKTIRAGRAAVNGAVTKRPETRIDMSPRMTSPMAVICTPLSSSVIRSPRGDLRRFARTVVRTSTGSS